MIGHNRDSMTYLHATENPSFTRDDEMKLQFPSSAVTAARSIEGRIRGMFNLNDPRWGRSDDKPADASKPDAPPPDNPPPPPAQAPQGGNDRGPNKGPRQGPPDLDELWRDFIRKLGGVFGGK